MKKTITFVLSLIIFCVTPLVSEELTIEYLDGFLDIKDGEDWIELYIGDIVTDEDTVRLDVDSVAELVKGSEKLTLVREGIYLIADLLNRSGQQRSVGLASVIGKKISTIVSGEGGQTQSAVMGVRGAEQKDEVQWMSSDTEELIESGKTHLEEGNLDDAIAAFEEAFDFADESEESEVLFYLGYAYANIGELPNAIDYLDFVEPDPETDFYPDLILLKGQLLTEVFAH